MCVWIQAFSAHGMKVRAAGQWLRDTFQLEQELTHVFPLSRFVWSATLIVFPSNAKVNCGEVCRRGVCPDPAEVRCVAVVEEPEYLCSSDRCV